MKISNGVLLFRAGYSDPDPWLRLNAMELAMAGQIFDKNPDFAAKALVVTNPARVQKVASGVPAYPWSEPFAPGVLMPFVEQLKGARSADARG